MSRVLNHLPRAKLVLAINTEVEAFLYSQKELGRAVVLVTATPAFALESVRLLFPFDEIHATTNGVHLSGKRKAEFLVERYGKAGFDYVGDERADRWVWENARTAMAVARSPRAARRIAGATRLELVFSGGFAGWSDWVKSLRLHHWTKNALLFVPAVAGHHVNGPKGVLTLTTGFLMMGMVTSGTYLWNDLFDREADRNHSRKKGRLAASGRASIMAIVGLSLVLVGAGLIGAFLVDTHFFLLLCAYIFTTLFYTLRVKKLVLTDLFLLTTLLLLRLVAGIIISPASVSFWLFAFAFLLFLSLAAAKRYVELLQATNRGDETVLGRGYLTQDLPVISSLGVSTGVASCVVLALYSNSPQVARLYGDPQWFWGICMLALYWTSRIWILTHRGSMHDDPLVFALTDKTTWIILALGLICLLLAQPSVGS